MLVNQKPSIEAWAVNRYLKMALLKGSVSFNNVRKK